MGAGHCFRILIDTAKGLLSRGFHQSIVDFVGPVGIAETAIHQ